MTSKATQPKPAPAVPVVVRIPLAQIDRGENYRRTWSDEDLAALADSIREHGVKQPIKVRPRGKDRYEIVYGFRRHAASQKAGAADIPATVDDVPDDQVLEEQLIENCQRADVHPLEEAEALERALEKTAAGGEPVYTVETLAKLVGRSQAHVYGRLKLTSLVPAARKAFHEGRLTTVTALYLARVPPGLQPKALQEITTPGANGELPAPRDVQDHLLRHYMLDLAQAPFACEDPELLPVAGACGKCPKRTGNAGTLFADVGRDDVCTDPECFERKVAAHAERAIAQAREAGHAVLTHKEAGKIFAPHGALVYGVPWIDLDERASVDPKNRTWRKLLAKQAPPITVAVDGRGKAHQLVARDAALKTLRDSGILAPELVRRATGGASDRLARESREKAAEGRKESFVHRETASRAMAALVAKVERRQPDRPFWLLWLDAITHGSWSDAIRDVCKRRGIPYDAKKTPPSAALVAAAAKLDPDQLRAVALEVTLSRGLYGFYPGCSNDFGRAFKAACERYEVDLAEHKKAARTALQEKIDARRAKTGARPKAA